MTFFLVDVAHSFVDHPAQWSAGAAVAAGTAACIAAATAVRTFRQARRDSAARTLDSANLARPYVIAELRSPPYSHGFQTLVVSNVGRTEARNLTVTFDPEIPDPDEPHGSVTPFLKARYARPIGILAPAQELDNLWYIGKAGPDGRFVNTEPTPDDFTVRFSYVGPTGSVYESSFALTVALQGRRTYTTASDAPEAQLRVAADALKAIGAQLKGGIEVHSLTAADLAQRAAAHRAQWEQHEAVAARLTGRPSPETPPTRRRPRDKNR